MTTSQLILYNQLRSDYLSDTAESYLYIHHTGTIMFQGSKLNLNPASKIIDYAGGKYCVEKIQESGKQAQFIEATTFYTGMIAYAQQHHVDRFLLVKPVEDYVYKNFVKIQNRLAQDNIELVFLPDTCSFLLPHEDFLKAYKTPPIMEYFYRFMRKKYNILMDSAGKPEGGAWNYDHMNRKFDAKHQQTWNFSLKKNIYVTQAEQKYTHTLQLSQPTNRAEALQLLEYFLENHLDRFGELEDAMYQNDPYVHHSMLSTSINFGFLSPQEVIQAVVKQDTAINNKEGFIRQILGWREYMFHFFHFYKDEIYQKNALGHTQALPSYFWEKGSDAPMNCLSTTLQQVQGEYVSHHIQRLMIIGNFALLNNYDPHELNRWFFEYYSDAFEWVVTPNVLSMSQYADGGKLATKPYIASANYINKMSDYCKGCQYDYKEKYSENACPYNYLYWNFVDENKTVFEKSRSHFVLKNLQKIDIDTITQLKNKFKTHHTK